jgi:hypothetical protein
VILWCKVYDGKEVSYLIIWHDEARVKILAICLGRCAEKMKAPFRPPLFRRLGGK